MNEINLIQQRKKEIVYEITKCVELDESHSQKVSVFLINRIKKTMKGHVGEDYFISADMLFKKVMNANQFDIEFYKRKYIWDIIKLLLRELRMKGVVFIINKK